MNPEYQQYLANPRAYTLKQWLGGLLGESANEHAPAVQRVASALATDGDMAELSALLTALYQAGYMRAVREVAAQLGQSGVKIAVTQPPPAATARSPENVSTAGK